ncbi:hypothetical protein V5799_023542 [Amblyomma americanum]|uniref:Transposable element n=1 Tax=Amblyomma americanum TaxID=6943 RepID=A0AAQ4FIZ7_AMBAM
MEHPCLPDASHHFICDVPHIMKCIRNHLMKHKYGQLFSRSVAIGLKVYRQLKVPGFSDSAGTETCTKLLNDIFDILNAKIPAAGLRRDSPKIKVLKDFLKMMNYSESIPNLKLFASNQTMESLRVTLMSVLSLIEFLHSRGVSYVLTASLNQDPLERFFGLVRSFGGDEDHPTVTNFGQLFCLLSLYTPVKLAVKANSEGGDDRVLLSAFASLGAKRREALTQKRKTWLKKRLKNILCFVNIPIVEKAVQSVRKALACHFRNIISSQERFNYCRRAIVAFW